MNWGSCSDNMAARHTIAIARDLLAEGHTAPVRELIDPRVRESGSGSDDGALLRALLAMARTLDGDATGGVSLLKEYREVDQRAGLSNAARAEVATWLAWATVAAGADRTDVARALTLLSEAEHVARSTHDLHGLAWALAGQAQALEALEEPAAAAMVLREARRLSHGIHHRLLDQQLNRLMKSTENSELPEDVTKLFSSAGIGGSDALIPVFETAHRAMETGLPILLVGEPGSGRTRLARSLHQGRRSAGAFQVLDTSERGHRDTNTPLSVANGKVISTVFVRDIDRLAPGAQDSIAQLLTDEQDSPQLIASTSGDPWALVTAGRLTRAVYERLCCVVVRIPPLRERPIDVNIIVRQYQQRSLLTGVPTFALTDDAWRALRTQAWPGNVEELIAELDRLTARCNADPTTVVSPEDLSVQVTPNASSDPLESWAGEQILHNERDLDAVLAEAERTLIRRTLNELSGNVTATAEKLGLSRQGLYKKMKRLQIDTARLHDSSHESVLGV